MASHMANLCLQSANLIVSKIKFKKKSTKFIAHAQIFALSYLRISETILLNNVCLTSYNIVAILAIMTAVTVECSDQFIHTDAIVTMIHSARIQ